MPARARRKDSSTTEARERNMAALLDAAEALLVEVGHAGITTRALAAKAGLNNGLVHYYFGAMEEVFVQVLERFTVQLIERQREMYASDLPFLEKWRTAWRYQDQDIDAGYSKVWLELQAMAWSDPTLAARVSTVNDEWRDVLTDAFTRALRDEYGVADQFPPEVMVAMVMTFAQGFTLERLLGITTGHEALLDWIESWLESLEQNKPAAGERREQ